MSAIPHERAPGVLAASAKDAALAALVALVLAAPLLGFKTVAGTEGLTLTTRWHLVGVAVAIVFFGRLLLQMLVWKRSHAVDRVHVPVAVGRGSASIAKLVGPLLLVIGLAWPFLPTTDRYLLDTGIVVLTYVMLGWGLNIVVGLAGLLDLGYVAFYAVGA